MKDIRVTEELIEKLLKYRTLNEAEKEAKRIFLGAIMYKDRIKVRSVYDSLDEKEKVGIIGEYGEIEKTADKFLIFAYRDTDISPKALWQTYLDEEDRAKKYIRENAEDYLQKSEHVEKEYRNLTQAYGYLPWLRFMKGLAAEGIEAKAGILYGVFAWYYRQFKKTRSGIKETYIDKIYIENLIKIWPRYLHLLLSDEENIMLKQSRMKACLDILGRVGMDVNDIIDVSEAADALDDRSLMPEIRKAKYSNFYSLLHYHTQYVRSKEDLYDAAYLTAAVMGASDDMSDTGSAFMHMTSIDNSIPGFVRNVKYWRDLAKLIKMLPDGMLRQFSINIARRYYDQMMLEDFDAGWELILRSADDIEPANIMSLVESVYFYVGTYGKDYARRMVKHIARFYSTPVETGGAFGYLHEPEDYDEELKTEDSKKRLIDRLPDMLDKNIENIMKLYGIMTKHPKAETDPHAYKSLGRLLIKYRFELDYAMLEKIIALAGAFKVGIFEEVVDLKGFIAEDRYNHDLHKMLDLMSTHELGGEKFLQLLKLIKNSDPDDFMSRVLAYIYDSTDEELDVDLLVRMLPSKLRLELMGRTSAGKTIPEVIEDIISGINEYNLTEDINLAAVYIRLWQEADVLHPLSFNDFRKIIDSKESSKNIVLDDSLRSKEVTVTGYLKRFTDEDDTVLKLDKTQQDSLISLAIDLHDDIRSRLLDEYSRDIGGITFRDLVRFNVDFSKHYIAQTYDTEKNKYRESSQQMIAEYFMLTAFNIYGRAVYDNDTREKFAEIVIRLSGRPEYINIFGASQIHGNIFKGWIKERKGKKSGGIKQGVFRLIDYADFEDVEKLPGSKEVPVKVSIRSYINRAIQSQRPL
ncbi:hypothetical protein ACFLTD_04745, partial [Elusimicrobiota bacterium]